MFRQKGIRSYFALKKMINFMYLKKSVVFKLFNTLIVPVVTYGCQVWFAETWFTRNMIEHSPGNRLSVIAKDPLERLHLTFLKWLLGVSRKTSNAAVWGDCGRYPLAVQISKQAFKYYDRLRMLETNDNNCIVKHAFKEQKHLNMKWYNRMNSMRNLLINQGSSMQLYPSRLRSLLKEKFEQIWDSERHQNKKLSFYNSIKKTFSFEHYLNINLKINELKRVAQFRMSAHKYNVETGRYGIKRNNVQDLQPLFN